MWENSLDFTGSETYHYQGITFKVNPARRGSYGYLTARDLVANTARALEESTCKINMSARYDRTIVI